MDNQTDRQDSVPTETFGRQEEIGRIELFLNNPPHNGGVLLVCGERGSGKTHLVDAALSGNKQKNDKQYLICSLLGECSLRRKKTVKRPPRYQERHIIQVPIDPFFPHITTNTKEKENENNRVDFSELQQLLIKNIIFALTSTLDPRYSVRYHGRTLRERLGWYDYWLSPTALWGSKYSMPFLKNILIAFIPLFVLLTSIQGLILPNESIHYSTLVAIILSCLTLPVIAQFFLRWLDWKALQKYSGRLYDLIHAEEAKQSLDNDRQFKLSHDGKTENTGHLLQTTAIALTAGCGVFIASGGSLPTNLNSPPVLALLAMLLGGIFTYSISHSKQKKWHRDFGTKNPAWRVTLLRRYLHLLHRCGIEPVLVIDELDKLDQHFPPSDSSTELNQFLEAFSRLKQSLGAHFFWVLVDEYRIFETVLAARKTPLQQAAATLIQDVVVIGSIPFVVASQQLIKIAPKVDVMLHPYYWIHAKGLFSGLREILDERHQVLALPLINRAHNLNTALSAVWDFEHPSLVQLFGYDNLNQLALKHHAYSHLLHNGMLAFANVILHFENNDNMLTVEDEMFLGGINLHGEYYLFDHVKSPQKFVMLGRICLMFFLLNADEEENAYLQIVESERNPESDSNQRQPSRKLALVKKTGHYLIDDKKDYLI